METALVLLLLIWHVLLWGAAANVYDQFKQWSYAACQQP